MLCAGQVGHGRPSLTLRVYSYASRVSVAPLLRRNASTGANCILHFSSILSPIPLLFDSTSVPKRRNISHQEQQQQPTAAAGAGEKSTEIDSAPRSRIDPRDPRVPRAHCALYQFLNYDDDSRRSQHTRSLNLPNRNVYLEFYFNARSIDPTIGQPTIRLLSPFIMLQNDDRRNRIRER